MANTYTQNYVHVVFMVKGRQNLITEHIRETVEKYMCGTLSNIKCKALSIYCNPDHVHILISMTPVISISDMMKEVKGSSSKFINEKKWIKGLFRWQDGFGSFTVSRGHVDRVAKYILNQPNHHRKSSFKEEYLEMLKENDVNYDEKYLFEWI